MPLEDLKEKECFIVVVKHSTVEKNIVCATETLTTATRLAKSKNYDGSNGEVRQSAYYKDTVTGKLFLPGKLVKPTEMDLEMEKREFEKATLLDKLTAAGITLEEIKCLLTR